MKVQAMDLRVSDDVEIVLTPGRREEAADFPGLLYVGLGQFDDDQVGVELPVTQEQAERLMRWRRRGDEARRKAAAGGDAAAAGGDVDGGA